MTTLTHAHPLFLTGRHPEFDAKGSRGFDNRQEGGYCGPSSGQHNRTHLKIKSTGNPNKGSECVCVCFHTLQRRSDSHRTRILNKLFRWETLNQYDHISTLKVLVKNKLSTNL